MKRNLQEFNTFFIQLEKTALRNNKENIDIQTDHHMYIV